MTKNSCDLIVETEFKGIHWRRSIFFRMFVDFVLNLSRRELGSVAVYCGAYLISECLHVHSFFGVHPKTLLVSKCSSIKHHRKTGELSMVCWVESLFLLLSLDLYSGYPLVN